MISNTALKYFLEIVRRGTMKSASEHLHVAASAISRQIKLVEDELGAPVFERRVGRTTLRLTTVGELLLQHAKHHESAVQTLKSAVEDVKGARAGAVRFGVTETFVTYFMPEFLARFSRAHPRITFRIEVDHVNVLTSKLVEDELDAMMGYNTLEIPELETIFQKTLPLHIVVSLDHPLATRESVSLSDCVGHSVGLLDSTSPMKRVFDEMFSRAEIKPEQILSSNSYAFIRSAAAAGMVVAFVSEHMSDPPKPSGNYKFIRVEDPRIPPSRFVVCKRRGRDLPLAVEVFLRTLITAMPTVRTE